MYDPNFAGKLENRTFVPKGWGWEDWIWNNNEYCGKKLFVKQGKRCSWHYHKLKDETFHVDSGEIVLLYGHDENILTASHVVLRAGHVFHVPRGLIHQFIANLDTVITEFSTQHFDDDSHRLIKGD
jgi:quercetin dioxygenase-like cupin family protein